MRTFVDTFIRDLEVADVFSYCGCDYKIVKLFPKDEHGLILMETIKSKDEVVLSDSFFMVRHEDDVVMVV